MSSPSRSTECSYPPEISALAYRVVQACPALFSLACEGKAFSFLLLAPLATDSQKRVFFEKLSGHLVDLASEIEASLREQTLAGGGRDSAIS